MRAQHLGSVPAAFAVGCLIAACLSSCSGGPTREPIADPYQAAFDEALAEAGSDFVADVLRDGEISAEEYRESMSRFAACLGDAGFEAVVVNQDNGLIAVNVPAQPPLPRSVEDTCARQWQGGIPGLYEGVTTNPDNMPWYDLLAACLVHQGVVPQGFTGDDMRAFEESAGEVTFRDTGDVEIVLDGSTGAPTLPGGAEYYSPEVEACLINPAQVMAD